ncbi:hypothetical protein DSH65_08715 [Enterococcus faecalis]|uniref:Uncharacterized protein n=2 Tax=Enterococcus faecalis TaxID=1351 RepID=A0ABD7J0Y3_ENTFL|nr:hypothetical protein [Enterococcus faecalis]EGO8448634.1 hypothetical protein [Enterococcus faecalis]EGO8468799.1 hypothetical protein [Enterococcus faecalis]EGO8540520.1 hypothetical protein [Enterococcus faecalis]EGO8542962.1 hypothetical protein [Enterococcus faecalis]
MMNSKKKEIAAIKMRKSTKKKCIICVSALFGMRILAEIGINYSLGKRTCSQRLQIINVLRTVKLYGLF